MPIAVADTGFVVAVVNREDDYHKQCVPVYQQHELIYLPQSTLAEVGICLHVQGEMPSRHAF